MLWSREMTAPGLYLHVPFCSAICPYCDFSVLKAGVPARRRFVEHLVRRSGPRRARVDDARPFDTVYFGGGTPPCCPPRTSNASWQRAARTCRSRRRRLDLPRGQPRRRHPRRLRRLAGPRRAHPLPRGAVRLRRGPPLPRPPAQRRAGPDRGRGGPGRRLRHRLGGPHLRPARPGAGGLAARVRDGRLARPRTRVVLSAHDPRAHPLWRRREARPALGDARGRAGRALRADAPRPRRRGLLRLRGLQLRPQPRP